MCRHVTAFAHVGSCLFPVAGCALRGCTGALRWGEGRELASVMSLFGIVSHPAKAMMRYSGTSMCQRSLAAANLTRSIGGYWAWNLVRLKRSVWALKQGHFYTVWLACLYQHV